MVPQKRSFLKERVASACEKEAVIPPFFSERATDSLPSRSIRVQDLNFKSMKNLRQAVDVGFKSEYY
jgi:hypothetical protein